MTALLNSDGERTLTHPHALCALPEGLRVLPLGTRHSEYFVCLEYVRLMF